MSMYLGIVPALTVLAMSISPEAPRLESMPRLPELSALTHMVSVTLPRDADRVTYDQSAGIIKIPRGVLALDTLERLIASPHVGFVVWSEQDALYLGLSSVHERAYSWRTNRIVLGTPRQSALLATPRQAWLGSQACIEEVPDFPVEDLRALWVDSCGGLPSQERARDPEALDLVMLGLRDNELRAWGELLKYARGDAQALDPLLMTRLEELSALFQRHAMLHLALHHANADDMHAALKALDRSRILGRRYDVRTQLATEHRITRLGNGWMMRLLIGLFQRGEEQQALELYDTYRHRTAQHPLWIKRRVAQSMRRSGRTREALTLYHEVLTHARPTHALMGELGTTYLEHEDVFRARSIQLWVEQKQGLAVQPDFTLLLQRQEADGSCPPDTSWTTRCIEAIKPDRGAHRDLLLDPSAHVAWGELVPTAGRVKLEGVKELAQSLNE